MRHLAALRLALPFAALALLVAAARPAGAQAACATATAAAYASEDFACRLGNWRLDDFSFGSGLSLGAGVGGAVGDASTVLLHPFVGPDAAGRVRFGFDFDGFAASVGIDGPTAGYAFGDASIGFGFRATALAPNVGLAGGQVNGTQWIGPSPLGTTTGAESAVMAVATAAYGQPENDCVDVRDVAQAPVGRTIALESVCPQPQQRPRVVFGSVQAWAQAWQEGAGPAVDARTTVTRLELLEGATAVPEPSTVSLLAAGLAVAAGALRRRRRGVRR